ncbi:insulin-like growth factor-binding protein complex acid labile subunit [Anabrus simplex]|uniref:insulin-like growth factor-binding protein complex acid labile subunit n=1 Tax=Anabrus simplex TaxID=316456 RepID=UPI0034DD55E9
MSTFLYTLLGLTVGSSLHCAVRREISPCACRTHEAIGTVAVACERMTSFAQVLDALTDKFPADTGISLKIAYSQLDDFSAHNFQQIGIDILTLKLNHDNLSSLDESVFNGLNKVEYLSLADNALPAIPQHVLRHMPLLKTLDLGRSHIRAVTTTDFQTLSDLQHLVLAGNAIATLEAMSMPHTLRHLHIGRNELTSLNGTLRGLTELEWLFVNGNLLSSLDDQLPPDGAKLMLIHAAFNKLERLPRELRNFMLIESLFFQNNELKNLGGALQKSRRLRRLDLTHNHIQELADDEFQELEVLEDLQLGHNKLSSLNGSLLPLRGLRSLNLTHNNFKEFSLQEILGLRRLLIIDLSSNNISRLSGQMTQNVVDLETRVIELRLEHNSLRALDGALMALHGLQRLNLSHNLLEKISPDDLIGLEELRVLDISFNRLTTLEETSKTFLPSLEGLFASNNLLTSLERDFHGLPILCWADISHNQIQYIGRDLVAKTRCRVRGVMATLRIYLFENPVQCDANLTDTIISMEANHTKLYGLACDTENLA